MGHFGHQGLHFGAAREDRDLLGQFIAIGFRQRRTGHAAAQGGRQRSAPIAVPIDDPRSSVANSRLAGGKQRRDAGRVEPSALHLIEGHERHSDDPRVGVAQRLAQSGLVGQFNQRERDRVFEEAVVGCQTANGGQQRRDGLFHAAATEALGGHADIRKVGGIRDHGEQFGSGRGVAP